MPKKPFVEFVKNLLVETTSGFPYVLKFREDEAYNTRFFEKFVEKITQRELVFFNKHLPSELSEYFPNGLETKEDVSRLFTKFIVKIGINYEYEVYDSRKLDIDFNEKFHSDIVFVYSLEPDGNDSLSKGKWLEDELPKLFSDYLLNIKEYAINPVELENHYKEQV